MDFTGIFYIRCAEIPEHPGSHLCRRSSAVLALLLRLVCWRRRHPPAQIHALGDALSRARAAACVSARRRRYRHLQRLQVASGAQLFFGGDSAGGVQLGMQVIGVVSVAAYSAFMTLLLLLLIDKAVGLRVHLSAEIDGLDVSVHGEKIIVAYEEHSSSSVSGVGAAVAADEAAAHARVVVAEAAEGGAKGSTETFSQFLAQRSGPKDVAAV